MFASVPRVARLLDDFSCGVTLSAYPSPSSGTGKDKDKDKGKPQSVWVTVQAQLQGSELGPVPGDSSAAAGASADAFIKSVLVPFNAPLEVRPRCVHSTSNSVLGIHCSLLF